MTQTEFENKIEGLVNDYDGGISTRQELFGGILDAIMELVKPKINAEQSLQAEIEKKEAEMAMNNYNANNVITNKNMEIAELKEKLRQHEGMSEQLSKVIYENADLQQKHSALVDGLKGLNTFVNEHGVRIVFHLDIEQLINKA